MFFPPLVAVNFGGHAVFLSNLRETQDSSNQDYGAFFKQNFKTYYLIRSQTFKNFIYPKISFSLCW